MFSEGGQETTVVDIHCHMTPAGAILAGQRGEEWHGVQMQQNESGNLTWEIGGHRMKLTWENPSLGWESRLTKMDEIGVDVQVMSLSPEMYWYGHLGRERALGFAQEANDSIAEAMAEHPTRFQGLAHLPLQDAQASVKELERCVKELGMAGVAVPGNVVGTDWDSPELYPIIEAAAGLDVVFFIHPASDVRFPPEDRYWFRNIIGIPLEETISLAALIFSGVFDKHPNLKVCMAHGGGFACFGLGRFDHAHKVRPECQHLPNRPSDYASNVYFDSLTHSYPKLRYLLDEIGGSKVVLGTDYPADMGQTEPVEWIRGADNLTTEERHAVLGRNVEALLGDRTKAFAQGAP